MKETCVGCKAETQGATVYWAGKPYCVTCYLNIPLHPRTVSAAQASKVIGRQPLSSEPIPRGLAIAVGHNGLLKKAWLISSGALTFVGYVPMTLTLNGPVPKFVNDLPDTQ